MGSCQGKSSARYHQARIKIRRSSTKCIPGLQSNVKIEESIRLQEIKQFFDQKIGRLQLLYRETQNPMNDIEQGILEQQNILIVAYTQKNKILGGFIPNKLKYYKYPLDQDKKFNYFKDYNLKTFVFSLSDNHKFPFINPKDNSIFTRQSKNNGKYEIGFSGCLYIQRQINQAKFEKTVRVSVYNNFFKGIQQSYFLNSYRGTIESLLGVSYQKHPTEDYLSRVECTELEVYKIHFQ